jgi:hypothetical protein
LGSGSRAVRRKTGSGVREPGARGRISPRASVLGPLYVGLVVNAAQEVKHAWALPAFRLSATVLPKFFPLYHFFRSHHQHFTPYFFISRSGSP